ncbi:MAG TPA: hypothetical protein V6C86_17640 [Oculatellaceae cyanobacterium]
MQKLCLGEHSVIAPAFNLWITERSKLLHTKIRPPLDLPIADLLRLGPFGGTAHCGREARKSLSITTTYFPLLEGVAKKKKLGTHVVVFAVRVFAVSKNRFL